MTFFLIQPKKLGSRDGIEVKHGDMLVTAQGEGIGNGGAVRDQLGQYKVGLFGTQGSS